MKQVTLKQTSLNVDMDSEFISANYLTDIKADIRRPHISNRAARNILEFICYMKYPYFYVSNLVMSSDSGLYGFSMRLSELISPKDEKPSIEAETEIRPFKFEDDVFELLTSERSDELFLNPYNPMIYDLRDAGDKAVEKMDKGALSRLYTDEDILTYAHIAYSKYIHIDERILRPIKERYQRYLIKSNQ